MKLAKFIFSKNLPFNVVEDDYFKDWLKEMRPSYTPPSRKVIAGPLLSQVYKEIKAELQEELKDKEVVLMQDGWSTTQNHPIIAHSVSVGAKNFFMQAIYTGTNEQLNTARAYLRR